MAEPARRTRAFSSISKLPDEILSLIIDEASDHYRHRSDVWDVTEEPRNDPVLLILSQVCRRWHKLALSSWERVEVYNSSEWLALVLSHSRQRLLAVTFHRANASLEALPLLETYARQVRMLSFCWPKGEYARRWRGINREMCQMSLPRLEELCIDNSEVLVPAKGAPGSQAVHPAASRFPALRTLRLSMAYIPWTSSIFEQLRALHLEDITPPPVLPLDEFIAVLGRCAYLEVLTLAHAFPVDFPDVYNPAQVRAWYPNRTASLPRLRTMHIAWGRSEGPWRDRMEVYQVMRRIRLPPRANVVIELEHWGPWEEHALYAVVHADKTMLPILGTATALRVTSVPKTQTVFTATNDAGTSLVVMVTNRYKERRWAYSVDNQLADLYEILVRAGAPIRTLSIDTWEVHSARVVRNSPVSLTALEIPFAGNDLLWDLLNWLAPIVSWREAADVPLVVPNLRRLQVGSLRWHEGIVPMIYSCLLWRAQRGTELCELRIEAYGRNGDLRDEIDNAAEILSLQMQMRDPQTVILVDLDKSPSSR